MTGIPIKLLFFTISNKLFVLRGIICSAPDIRRRITNFSLYDNILFTIQIQILESSVVGIKLYDTQFEQETNGLDLDCKPYKYDKKINNIYGDTTVK